MVPSSDASWLDVSISVASRLSSRSESGGPVLDPPLRTRRAPTITSCHGASLSSRFFPSQSLPLRLEVEGIEFTLVRSKYRLHSVIQILINDYQLEAPVCLRVECR